MFDQPELENRSLTVFVENGDISLLCGSNFGLDSSLLNLGWCEMSFEKACRVIEFIDKYIDQITYKSGRNRARSFRNSVVMAFGPDMETLYPLLH